MKKILLILLFAAPFLSNSQGIDSTKILQKVTLKASQLEHIKNCIPSGDQPRWIRLFNEIARQIDTTDNPEQLITISPESGQIVEAFVLMGQEKEYYASQINQEMKNSLIKQITNPWLGARLMEIEQNYAEERERRRKEGFNFYKSIKP